MAHELPSNGPHRVCTLNFNYRLPHLGHQAVQRLCGQPALLLFLLIAAAAAALHLLLVHALQDLQHLPLLVLPCSNTLQLRHCGIPACTQGGLS